MLDKERKTDYHALGLGKITGNLHSLELLLRLFLHNVDLKRYNSPPPEVNLDKIKVGDVVSENYFTNWDTLGELVEKYNNLVTTQKTPELRVDERVVNLRDALAHGRVLGQDPAPPLRLYKFGKPTKGHRVTVEYVADLPKDELASHIHRLFQQAKKVKRACERFCPSALG